MCMCVTLIKMDKEKQGKYLVKHSLFKAHCQRLKEEDVLQ